MPGTYQNGDTQKRWHSKTATNYLAQQNISMMNVENSSKSCMHCICESYLQFTRYIQKQRPAEVRTVKPFTSWNWMMWLMSRVPVQNKQYL